MNDKKTLLEIATTNIYIVAKKYLNESDLIYLVSRNTRRVQTSIKAGHFLFKFNSIYSPKLHL